MIVFGLRLKVFVLLLLTKASKVGVLGSMHAMAILIFSKKKWELKPSQVPIKISIVDDFRRGNNQEGCRKTFDQLQFPIGSSV